ncbi:unnamed protein product [Caenorhabditis auriculariae]|uniref:mitogen-activated protein kinase kinase n=1 Tax=Caenorhabditis auriculariae TaxID=2777116 RepID=A0A8S1H6F8_9PELO|nr:unnamed protein product [Caenorhabditis auriculariae]
MGQLAARLAEGVEGQEEARYNNKRRKMTPSCNRNKKRRDLRKNVPECDERLEMDKGQSVDDVVRVAKMAKPPEQFNGSEKHAMVLLKNEEAVTMDHERAGEKCGFSSENYVLGRLIGEGSFAKVYKATSSERNEVIAVKVLRPTSTSAPESDVNNLRKLCHERIVNYFSVVEKPNGLRETHVLMEYMPDDLAKFIKREGSLGPKLTISYTVQIAEGLEFLHSQSIIHHDIKPSNILLRVDAVKIADFGSSVFGNERRKRGKHATTPMYSAPEVSRGTVNDVRSDIWSLGVVLVEMSQGIYPWDVKDKPVALIPHILEQEPPSMDKMSEDLISLANKMICRVDQRVTASQVLSHPHLRTL